MQADARHLPHGLHDRFRMTALLQKQTRWYRTRRNGREAGSRHRQLGIMLAATFGNLPSVEASGQPDIRDEHVGDPPPAYPSIDCRRPIRPVAHRVAGYIFDVEGTLVDSVQQNLLSLQEALADFGIRVPYEVLQLYSGLDGDQTLQLVAPDLAAADRKWVLEAKGKLYERKYLAGVKAFTGVREVLETLTKDGGMIALATDCKGAPLRHYLSLLGVDDLIDSMACGDDVEHGKPDPRLVGLALRKLEVPAGQAVMIGDTPYDAEAATRAGTAAAGLLTGGFTRKALTEGGCFAVAGGLRELLDCLRNAPPRLSIAATG
jgi:HAD superfamily hydrolase (TIGR01509 family)